MKEQWQAFVRDKRSMAYVYGAAIAFLFALFTFIFKDRFSLEVSLTDYLVLVASILFSMRITRAGPYDWRLISAFISGGIIYLLRDQTLSVQFLVLVTILATLHLTREQVPILQLASVIVNAVFIYLAQSQLDKSGIIFQIDEGQVPIRFSTHYLVTVALLLVLYFTRTQPIMVKESSAVSVGFLSWFAAKEFDGLIVLGDTIVNALNSAGNFFDSIRVYFFDVAAQQTYQSPFFTWFEADWISPLSLSMLIGAGFGALMTILVYLHKGRMLKLPSLSDRALGIGLFTAILIEFNADWLAIIGIDIADERLISALLVSIVVTLIAAYTYEDQLLQIFSDERPEIVRRLLQLHAVWLATFTLAAVLNVHFWAELLAGGLIALLLALLYEGQAESYLRSETLTALIQPKAGPAALKGLFVGGAVGAIGSQILNYPLKHCTFGPDLQVGAGVVDISRLEFRMGVVITIVSTLLLLLPTWTLIRRGGFAPRRGFTSGYFNNNILPYVFLFPTLFILVVFLYYPGVRVVALSLKLAFLGRPNQADYCLTNYESMVSDSVYRSSFMTSLVLTVGIVAFSMTISLGIAALASQKIRGIGIYRTLLIWPYAISPVVAGVMLKVAFDPVVGVVNYGFNEILGTRPQWFSDTTLAPIVVIGAAVWNSIGFNVLFYMAGLQSIPTDLLEAAAIDGANRFQRFMRVTIPLLSPYSFFLLITNITYSFFGLFGVVDILTNGGPFRGVGDEKTGATNVLIYNIYDEFFNSRRLGSAAAQSLVLFMLVAAITILQFRYVERRVTYGGEG